MFLNELRQVRNKACELLDADAIRTVLKEYTDPTVIEQYTGQVMDVLTCQTRGKELETYLASLLAYKIKRAIKKHFKEVWTTYCLRQGSPASLKGVKRPCMNSCTNGKVKIPKTKERRLQKNGKNCLTLNPRRTACWKS